MDFTRKHALLQRIVQCPTCGSDLQLAGADRLHDLPIAGIAACRTCATGYPLANGKYLFNEPMPIPDHAHGGKALNDSISVTDVPLDRFSAASRLSWTRDPSGLYSTRADARLMFESDAFALGLVFLKHPWSGIAEILVDGRIVATIDLFEPEGSMRYWQPVSLGSGRHRVEIVNTGRKNPDSVASQVWLVAAESLDQTRDADAAFAYPPRNDGNPYPARFGELIADCGPDATILDCGSGDRCFPDPRVVNFEYSRFRSPDVFGDGHHLPFKTGVFDLVLSQAVVEHLYDPFQAVREIHRVLKPGGLVYCESAFMQPLHAVPYHFFNTTVWGIERLFCDFVDVEVGYDGTLTQTLAWIYSQTDLRRKGQGSKVDQLLKLAGELDADITRDELKRFASYVTLIGRKADNR